MSNTKIGLPSCLTILVINVAIILSSKMWAAPLETSVEKLWVNPDSAVGQNLAYSNKWSEGTPGSEVELFTTQTVPAGKNVANPETVGNLFALTQAVYDITVRVNDTDYTTYDMCLGRSSLTSYIAGCSQYTIVDFFKEGSFATPLAGMTQYLLDSRLAYPSGSKYMLNWAATADGLAGSTTNYFGQIFDDQCVVPGLLACKEKSAFHVPYPYNNTLYGTGPGTLFKQLNTMSKNMTSRLSKQARFQATWIMAKGILRGMMVTQAATGAGTTCANWNAAANSQVPSKTAWSLVPCGLAPGGGGSLCSSATCSIDDLDKLSMGTFTDVKDCGKCVGAVLFWTQNIRDIQVEQSVSMPSPAPAPFAVGPLFQFNIYSGVINVTNPSVEETLFTAGAECPSNIITKEKRIRTGDCLLMWDIIYASRSQYEQGLIGKSEDTMRTALPYMTIQPPREPVADAVPLYTFSNDTLDAIAFFDRLTATSKNTRDAAWRALLATGAYQTVLPTMNRHSTRPSYVGATESDILLTVSGVDNDFSILQNATRVIMGGTTPDLDRVLGGVCECTPGFSGSRCENPVDDGVCECGNDVNLGFPPKCVQDVLYGCLPYIGCMGIGNIQAFISIKALLFATYDFSPLSSMIDVATVLGSQLPSVANTSSTYIMDIFAHNCEEFVPCFELGDDFNWTAVPKDFPNFPPRASFEPVVNDAGYVIAQAADLDQYPTTIKLIERAMFLARRALKHSDVSGAATAITNYNAILSGLVATDLTNLQTCLGIYGNSKLRSCFNTTSLVTPIMSVPSTTCPLFTSQYGSNIITLQQYFQCVVDEIHKTNGHKARRSTAGLTAYGSSNSLKTSMCSAAITSNMTKAQCRAGYAGLMVTSAYTFTIGQIDMVPILPSLPVNVVIPYALFQAHKYLWAQSMTSPPILAAIKRDSFGNSDTRLRAGQDAAFARECALSTANHPPINMLPADCQVVFNKVPIAADVASPSAAPAKSDIGVAMVKYKLTGAVLGVCGIDARSRNVGGAECWKDTDCGSLKGGGKCSGVEFATPVSQVLAFGSITFTNQAIGLINRMKDPTTARYREMANAPILAKKTGSDPPSKHVGAHDLTLDDANKIGRLWRAEFIRVIEAQSGKTGGATTTALSTGTISDEIAKYSEANISLVLAGYILMLVYAQLSLISPQKDWKHTINHSRGLVGMTGVILVSLAVASGLGITLLAGYHWSAVATQILPYVMLGLGVNDVFVLVRTFPEYRDDLTTEEAAGQGIGIAAAPMTFSNITNSCVFAIGILTGMPIIQVMAAQASIITATNYFTNIMSMPWLLSIDYERQRNGRADIAPCIQIVNEPESVGKGGGVSRNIFNTKCIPTYAKFLLSKPGKAVTMVYMFGLIIAGAVGVGVNIELGLSLADIAPSGSSIQKALAIRDQYFSFHPFYVAFPELDYSPRDTQQAITTLTDSINALEHVMDDSGIAWTKAFMAWGLPTGLPNYNLFTLQRPCDINSANTNGKCGAVFNCTVVLDDLTILDGKVPFYAQTEFYRCLEIWMNSDALYDALNPGIRLLDPDAQKGFRKLYFSVADEAAGVYKLPYSTITFFATGLNTNPDFVALIKETESVANQAATPPSYPGGEPIQYFDQYVGLITLINTALGYGLAVVFGITFLAIMVVGESEVPIVTRLISAVWMGALVTGVIAMSVYEVWAFMTYSAIKISAIPAISLIMSLGADVGFNVFFASTFATAHGTRDERVREALDIMMAPAFDGAITVFLGVVCLAFSPLGFIVKYFFLVWVIILWLGLTNAFVFMPVLLSIGGPPPITINKNGGGSSSEKITNKE
jgi:hypothetical protein